MSILNESQNYERLNTCNKCGFCQASCSVYKEVLNEAFATRGRLRLIKAVADGELERTPYYEKIINSCLMCEECSTNCPSGVQGHALIQMAREDLANIKGIPLIKKLPIEKVLPNNILRKFSFDSFRLFKNLVINPLSSLHSIRGINLQSLPIAKEDFLSSYKPSGLVKRTKFRVGFFIGCMMNHTMPEVANSVVRVLERYDCEVIVPKEQRCCGTPAHVYGHRKASIEMAAFNIKLFTELGVDHIITACASCGGMLKNYGKLFTEDKELNEQAANFSNKMRDITQYLIDDLAIKLDKITSPISGKITYHDPCHLVRGQNISTQPREILQGIKGHDYVEMPGASKCCGASGMFQGFYPNEATAISNKKIANIRTTNADYVITNCPACHHRIQGSLKLNNMPQPVVHIVQLLDPEFSTKTLVNN
jgi:glycolate oxidase iron-sulfur subunit